MIVRYFLIVLVFIFSFVGLFLLFIHHGNTNSTLNSILPLSSSVNKKILSLGEGKELLNLISLQNETITALRHELSALQTQHKLSVTSKHLPIKHEEIQQQPQRISFSDMENECENRYGLNLIDLWSRNEQIWCSDGKGSELKCYPYHQKHKKLDGRGPDMFCEATNFVMDFSKVFSLFFFSLHVRLLIDCIQCDSGPWRAFFDQAYDS